MDRQEEIVRLRSQCPDCGASTEQPDTPRGHQVVAKWEAAHECGFTPGPIPATTPGFFDRLRRMVGR